MSARRTFYHTGEVLLPDGEDDPVILPETPTTPRTPLSILSVSASWTENNADPPAETSASALDFEEVPSYEFSELLPLVEVELRKAHGELVEIWDEVGFSNEERRRQFGQILKNIKMVCTDKLAEESTLRAHFVTGIQREEAEIHQLVEQLREDLDSSRIGRAREQNLTAQLATLEAYADDLRSKRDGISDQLQELKTRGEEIVHLLGEEDIPEQLRDVENELTSTRIAEFERVVSQLEGRLQERKNLIARLVSEIRVKLLELKEGMRTPLERQVMGSLVPPEEEGPRLRSITPSEDCVGVSGVYVTQLTVLNGRLDEEKKQRRARLETLGEQIRLLWDRLAIDREFQDNFESSVDALGMDTLEKGEEELRRLEHMQHEKMAELVSDLQHQIRSLWDQLGMPASPITSLLEGSEGHQEEKSDFPSFATYMKEDVSADTRVLERLEQEKDALVLRCNLVRPIIEKIAQREQLINERMELEELKKDKDRLLGRNSVHQRKKEEKMEKRIKEKLPTLTDSLKKTLLKWQQENEGERFMYEGRPYLETIAESERSWRQYLAEQAKDRAKRKQQNLENHQRRTSQGFGGVSYENT